MRLSSVRAAVRDRADLARFRERPDRRLLIGMVGVALGIILGWPAVGVLASLAVALDASILLTVVSPLVYGGSWIIYVAGIAIGGPEALAYLRDLMRWATRITVEWMLGPEAESEARADAEPSSEEQP